MLKKYSYINVAATLLTILLVIMPFHAAIVTIAGHFLPYKTILQAWKEITILVIGMICLYAFYRDKKLFEINAINKLVLVIVLLSIGLSLINFKDITTLLAGIKTNLVVLVLFLEAQVLANKYNFEKIFKILILPAVFVAIIAILQPYLLKPDFLSAIGYGEGSIIAEQFVESTQDSIRVFSTLGGPNQLGAYMIVPFALSLAWAVKSKKPLRYLLPLLFMLPIYMSYSRSAWIGALVAATTVLVLRLKPKLQLVVGVAAIFAIGIAGYLFYTDSICRYFSGPAEILIHGDCRTGNLGGSDMMRVDSLERGIAVVVSKPFGSGLGTAGPASFYSSMPLIVENWYLQLAIEIGIMGLILYLIFVVLVMKKLYTKSMDKDSSVLPSAFFAIMCGVLVSSLFLHTLTDSTLSIVLFGSLGLLINSRYKEGKI